MFAKITIISALIAVTLSSPIHEDYHHHHPKYNFKYGVEDPHTRDIKEHHEERDGDVVRGEYSWVEPDRNVQVAYYTSENQEVVPVPVAAIPLTPVTSTTLPAVPLFNSFL